jgi:hypothetical protein
MSDQFEENARLQRVVKHLRNELLEMARRHGEDYVRLTPMVSLVPRSPDARVTMVETKVSTALEQENARLTEALTELVDLKDDVKQRDPADYKRRKPLAWNAARVALGRKRKV